MRSLVQVQPDPPIRRTILLGIVGGLKLENYGAIAQLGERLPCTQEVSGSIPLSSTTLREKGEVSEAD